MVSPFLYFPGERLAMSELRAACLDGLLVPLGEGFMPADAVETAWMRARSLTPLLGDRWVGVRLTAAWIHGGMPTEPARHHLQRLSDTRRRPPAECGTIFHDVRLPAVDTVSLAGVHLSSVGRTLADLARSDDERQQSVAFEWAVADPAARGAAEAWLERHPSFPFRRRGAALLAGTRPGGE